MYASDIGKVMKAIHCDKIDIGDIMIVSPVEQHTIRSVVGLICKHMDFSGEVVYDTSKPEGIMKKPTINDEFVDFIVKASISLTSLDAGLELSVQDFIRRYPNVRK
jgi:hypothetical protein